MNKPEEYILNVWKESAADKRYVESFLHMRPAPEYATGEVVLASLYRNIGFAETLSEGKVPASGREFMKRLERDKCYKACPNHCIGYDTWRGIVTASIHSPRQPNQTTKRFLQLCPIVPDATLYSLSARLSSNSWNPGALVARILTYGMPNSQSASDLWGGLYTALSVDNEDDIWAQFLQQEFLNWRSPQFKAAWSAPSRSFDPVKGWCPGVLNTPAGQFVQDLCGIIPLKKVLTRRQWISIVESILRIGTASHIMWLCRANAECFRIFKDVLEDGVPRSAEDITGCLSLDCHNGFWRYGQSAAKTIRDFAREYVVARAGINLLLCHCSELDEMHNIHVPPDPLANPATIAAFTSYLCSVRSEFPHERFRANFNAAIEADPRVVACKRGISSNISEFLRHVLGQRQTPEQGMETYDQGYYLRKRGNYSSAPWIVSFGPVSVLLFVYCATVNAKGPRTVEDLCRHLSTYGVEVQAQDISRMDLGQSLRNLGLILDSPDAEGGMVLVNPFKARSSGDTQ